MRTLTDTAKATILLCSYLGLAGNGAKPYSQAEWYQLGSKILQSDLKEPGRLFGLSAMEIETHLACTPQEAERIARLLSRGMDIGFELDRLGQQGIDIVTKSDEDYPKRLMQVLGSRYAPPVIFYCGNLELAHSEGIAIVGSRHVDGAGLDMALQLGAAAAEQGLTVYSGGARGVDQASGQGALQHGGSSVAFLTGDLARTSRRREARELIAEGRLLLLCDRLPTAGFTVGAAMNRNKYVYALSQAGFVIASDKGHGGTWAGATETLKKGWVPVFVWTGTKAAGNQALIREGGLPFGAEDMGNLSALLERSAHGEHPMQLESPSLFEMPAAADTKPAASPISTPVVPSAPSEPVAEKVEEPELAPGEEIFQKVWPILARLFKQESDPKKVWAQCEGAVQKGQMDLWISMAVKAQLLKKETRPVRYSVIHK